MIEIKKMKKLEDYQLRELQEEKLFINKYDFSLKYDYELSPDWKAFFFDVLAAMARRDDVLIIEQLRLFENFKENYYNIIKDNDLKIDIRDYVEISDYITYREWLCDKRNMLIKVGLDFYLIEIR